MGCAGDNSNSVDAVGSPGRVLGIQLVKGWSLPSLLAGPLI